MQPFTTGPVLPLVGSVLNSAKPPEGACGHLRVVVHKRSPERRVEVEPTVLAAPDLRTRRTRSRAVRKAEVDEMRDGDVRGTSVELGGRDELALHALADRATERTRASKMVAIVVPRTAPERCRCSS